MSTAFGFLEHAHTADWELEVWAPDLPTLLEQAARGMYTMAGVTTDSSSRQERSISIKASDSEGLLVRFLSELLWLEQEEKLAFDHFIIDVQQDKSLWAELCGAPIVSLDKEIKAVTYHNLNVETTSNGLRVNIVFDV